MVLLPVGPCVVSGPVWGCLGVKPTQTRHLPRCSSTELQENVGVGHVVPERFMLMDGNLQLLGTKGGWLVGVHL